MKTLRIALYPGDGIGPEVLDEAVRVLESVCGRIGGFALQTTRFPWGVAYHHEHGAVVPPDFLDELRGFDAILLGALGDPRSLPDYVTLAPLVRIRQRFDQYVCLRPCRCLPGVASPLVAPGDIDFVVLRENSEGEYVDCGARFRTGEPGEVAIQTAIHTRFGVERMVRFGFELAMTRRRRLTLITKSNAQRYGGALWEDVLEEVRGDFPKVETERQLADAALMNLVRQPAQFDVVVASNLFGDLLTDVGGVITGGLGLAPSANINPQRRFPSMFEPVHGSALDIAGQGIANPVAMILSAAMMLDHLELPRAAGLIRAAVAGALAEGARTRDLGGTLTTTQMTDRIIANLVDEEP